MFSFWISILDFAAWLVLAFAAGVAWALVMESDVQAVDEPQELLDERRRAA